MADKIHYPRLTPDAVAALKKYGFKYVVIVNRDISARTPGAVEACFRSLNDAKRFATSLCKIYGAKNGWVGTGL